MLLIFSPTHDVGAVAGLRRVKCAISVARKVLEITEHTLLVGDSATEFALQVGFKEENLTSDWSRDAYIKWKQNKCQPNYWRNVKPNPKTGCGPYTPERQSIQSDDRNAVNEDNHDTIGIIAIDRNGTMAVGTSTNGMIHKIPGSVHSFFDLSLIIAIADESVIVLYQDLVLMLTKNSEGRLPLAMAILL